MAWRGSPSHLIKEFIKAGLREWRAQVCVQRLVFIGVKHHVVVLMACVSTVAYMCVSLHSECAILSAGIRPKPSSDVPLTTYYQTPTTPTIKCTVHTALPIVLTTSYSLLPTPYSLPSTHYAPLTTHYS